MIKKIVWLTMFLFFVRVEARELYLQEYLQGLRQLDLEIEKIQCGQPDLAIQSIHLPTYYLRYHIKRLQGYRLGPNINETSKSLNAPSVWETKNLNRNYLRIILKDISLLQVLFYFSYIVNVYENKNLVEKNSCVSKLSASQLLKSYMLSNDQRLNLMEEYIEQTRMLRNKLQEEEKRLGKEIENYNSANMLQNGSILQTKIFEESNDEFKKNWSSYPEVLPTSVKLPTEDLVFKQVLIEISQLFEKQHYTPLSVSAIITKLVRKEDGLKRRYEKEKMRISQDKRQNIVPYFSKFKVMSLEEIDYLKIYEKLL